MNIWESARIALRGLRTNRLRSALTMLGIIIGVAAVIVLVAFGNGLQGFINGAFGPLANQITITKSGGSVSGTGAVPRDLTDSDVTALSSPVCRIHRAISDPSRGRLAEFKNSASDIGLSIAMSVFRPHCLLASITSRRHFSIFSPFGITTERAVARGTNRVAPTSTSFSSRKSRRSPLGSAEPTTMGRGLRA